MASNRRNGRNHSGGKGERNTAKPSRYMKMSTKRSAGERENQNAAEHIIDKYMVAKR